MQNIIQQRWFMYLAWIVVTLAISAITYRDHGTTSAALAAVLLGTFALFQVAARIGSEHKN